MTHFFSLATLVPFRRQKHRPFECSLVSGKSVYGLRVPRQVATMSSPIDEFKMDKVGVPEAKQAKGKYKNSGNNPISVLFFYKTVKLFMRGNKKELEIEDLGEAVKADLSQPLGDALER